MLGISVLIIYTYTDINLYLLIRVDICEYHVSPVYNLHCYAHAICTFTSFTSFLSLCCSDGSCDQHWTAVGGYRQFSAAGPNAGRCYEEDARSG